MSKKILVVGDSMVDLRLDCEVNRVSPEAPIPIYDLMTEEAYAGGAANVALNIAAMGGDVELLTAFGDDVHGSWLSLALDEANVKLRNTHALDTTTKTRMVVNDVVRVRMDRDWILEEDESDALCAEFEMMVNEFDIIVFSDYGKGALRDISRMLAMTQRRITIVDPKARNWERYAGANIIKANAKEMEEMGLPPAHALRKFNLNTIIATCGAAGSTVYYDAGYAEPVPALPVQCVDPTGAGDSYLAALAVELAKNSREHIAARRASVAGALATTEMGTKIVTSEEIDEWLPQLTLTL